MTKIPATMEVASRYSPDTCYGSCRTMVRVVFKVIILEADMPWLPQDPHSLHRLGRLPRGDDAGSSSRTDPTQGLLARKRESRPIWHSTPACTTMIAVVPRKSVFAPKPTQVLNDGPIANIVASPRPPDSRVVVLQLRTLGPTTPVQFGLICRRDIS